MSLIFSRGDENLEKFASDTTTLIRFNEIFEKICSLNA